MKNVKPFVSKSEISRRRGISRVSVYALIRRGLLPVDAHGRIPRHEFEQMEAGSDADFNLVCTGIKEAFRSAGQTDRAEFVADILELLKVLLELKRRKKIETLNNMHTRQPGGTKKETSRVRQPVQE